MQSPVERLRTGQVAAERLLYDHPGVIGAAALLQSLDHAGEHARRNGEVVNRTLCKSYCILQLGESFRVRVVSIDVAQQRGKLVKARGVEIAALLHAVARTLLELVQVPAGARHADDGKVKAAAAHHGIQPGKDL